MGIEPMTHNVFGGTLNDDFRRIQLIRDQQHYGAFKTRNKAITTFTHRLSLSGKIFVPAYRNSIFKEL